MKRLLIVLSVLVVLAGTVAVVNSSGLWGSEGRPLLLAHRGLGQTFDLAGVENDTCTATRIHPPEHTYLENTLPSMRAALEAGAALLEFDVQVSADGQLVVFHDPTLDCRTDGTGPVAEHTLAELRKLDLGYGYSADGGASYPLRGTGRNLLVTVPEVVGAFPGRELLMDLKNDDPAEAERLAAYLSTLPAERLGTMAVVAGDTAAVALRTRLPGLRVSSRKIIQDCLIGYLAVGGAGIVPDACRGTDLRLPARYGRWLWGWPNLFVDRMRAAGTRVVLVAGDGPWSEGFDRPDQLADVPAGWSGYLWTNRVDAVAPAL